MCNPKPGSRCHRHAYERYIAKKNHAHTSEKAYNEYRQAEHDYDIVVMNKATTARATIEYFEDNPENFQLLDKKGREDYDRDFELLTRYVQLHNTLPQPQFQALRDEARARGNLGHYLSSKHGHPTKFNVPTANDEIVEMFNLLKTDPAGRPLTAEEQTLVDEADELLGRGEINTDHKKRKALRPETQDSSTATVISSLQSRLSPSEQERVRAAREIQRDRLLRAAQDGSLGTPVTVNPSRLPANPPLPTPRATAPTLIADADIPAPKGVNSSGLRRTTTTVPGVKAQKAEHSASNRWQGFLGALRGSKK